MPWTVLGYIKLNEDETTSSSRIFIKIMFHELSASLGLAALKVRLDDPYMSETFAGIMPKDNPRNCRFAINFFTAIGLGGLTDGMRTWLKNAPKMIMARQQQALADAAGDDSSSDSDSDSSGSSSGSSSSSGSDSDSSSSSGSDSDSESNSGSDSGSGSSSSSSGSDSGSDSD